MLQIQNICKQYKTGDLVQQALDHVSLNLRDNEFVAILGPSGSGKTTLLNIIGGLDRYDSGDLIINDVSTKKYKDRDWDSYRNHTIGFVFQSYNLIPHQTVLANVELALTISGISGSERRKRAEEALKKVGLGEQMHKKPNQMSGGQMQRVAIARALVNNPDILLADEPTGALDSETSVQVMDLLKEVAKDRLVVMVTHNPDLAYQYANRIIKLKDGQITDDSNPLLIDEKAVEKPVHKNLGKASMSFLTALSLSFQNLLTKKARTILVSFAGSIGIIGIALIMSLSNGLNQYIQHTEQESLAEYPLEIDSTSLNLTSLLQGNADDSDSDSEVKEKNVVTRMFGEMSSNDLKSLKEYIDDNGGNINQYARSIEYRYNLTPRIYRMNGDEVIQVNPNDLLSSSGIAPTSSAYSSSFSMNVFSRLPTDAGLYEDSYEVKAGRWPEKYNELVVVLDQDGALSDMVSYTLGLRDYDELKEIVESSEDGTIKSTDQNEDDNAYSYDDILGKTFQLVNAADLYTYDDNLKVWSDRSNDEEYVRNLVKNGDELKIVGIVQPESGSDISMLSEGIGFRYDLTEHVIEASAASASTQAQLADPDINIFTGQAFGSESSESFDMSSLFSIDENALANAFSIDTSRLGNINTARLASSIQLPDVSTADLEKAFSNIDFSQLQNVDLTKILNDLLQAYFSQSDVLDTGRGVSAYLQSQGYTILVNDLNAFIEENGNKEAIQNEINTLYSQLADTYIKSAQSGDSDDLITGFESYLGSEDVQNQIYAEVQNIVTTIQLSDEQKEKLRNDIVNGYTSYASENNYPTSTDICQEFENFLQSDQAQEIMMNDLNGMIDVQGLENQIISDLSSTVSTYTNAIGSSVSSAVTNMMSSLVSSLPNAFSINVDAFQNAIQINMDADQLQEAISSMMSSQSSSYENNLKELGYAELDNPATILIYPNDFDAKTEIKNILDAYNTSMEEQGEDDKVISYTDMVATLMSSVTRIVNTVSWALIAFVAISLVVSSIMIGVITYISVLERRKEIGILRAIGASKHNVSEVFNAETFITGLLAGAIGVAIACLLLIPGNHLIVTISGRTDLHASLPVRNAVELILLSVLLTLISGLIPARKAANSDPVAALRTE